MDRCCYFILICGLIGCVAKPQIALKQNQEIIENKALFSVHRNGKKIENTTVETMTAANTQLTQALPLNADSSLNIEKRAESEKYADIVEKMLASQAIVTAKISAPKKNKLPRTAKFTIQVVALKSDKDLPRYIAQLSKDKPMWLNEKKMNGEVMFALLYGEFVSLEAAEIALKQLPKNFIEYGAFIKSFAAITQSNSSLEPIFR